MAAEVTPGAPQTDLASPPATDKPTVDEFVNASPHLSFWQSPFVQKVLPFLTSLLLHIGLVVLLWATYTVAEKVYTVVKEQIIIPDSTIVENGPVGGVQNPGLGDDPTRQAAQDQFADVPAQASGWSSNPSQSLESSLAGSGGNADPNALIGVGSGGGFGSGDKGVGSGTGTGGGPVAPFGVPGGGQGTGPKSQFMGVGGNAVKIVYVCDASGTMLNAMDALQDQLRRSISDLKPIQAFNVFFFRNADVIALQKTGLMMARADNKRKAYEFIKEVTAYGATSPLPAIEAAFAAKPELVYILTDGFDMVSSYDDVLMAIRRFNPGSKIKVNTILIKTRADAALEKVMQEIADENGGRFIIVNSDDMR